MLIAEAQFENLPFISNVGIFDSFGCTCSACGSTQ
jgi:hypothetical protein